jgi:Tol biopolymer transport system component
MTPNDTFDRSVVVWLDAQAGSGAPDYLDDILQRTARSRQRPAWTSIERWLPLDLTARPPLIGSRVPWRPIALFVALALIVAATLLVYIGSRQPIPPPFGPARNGAVVYATAGDLFLAGTDVSAPGIPVVTGPRNDFDPLFSPSGRFLAFSRSTSTAAGLSATVLAVASADGSSVRELSGPLVQLSQVAWSPDESRIAIVSEVEGRASISIVDVQNSATQTLPIDMAVDLLSWRPADGREIIFRAHTGEFDAQVSGLFAIRPDGSNLKPLTSKGKDIDYRTPALSPDGTTLTYDQWNGSQNDIHVLDLASGRDDPLPRFDPLTDEGGVALFSPDGRLVVFERYYDGGDLQLAVAPSNGSSAGIGIGLRRPMTATPNRILYAFSPDGLTVIARYADDRSTYVLPVDGSPGTKVPWGDVSLPTMQRLAP